jgi:hypothetical protein
MQDAGGSTPADFTRDPLKRMKEQYPSAETNEIAKTDDSSTVEFLILATSRSNMISGTTFAPLPV